MTDAPARLWDDIPHDALADLVYVMSASAASLAAVWDNDEDAVYDAY